MEMQRAFPGNVYRQCLPLEIPCILSHIIAHLPLLDLQRSRLVSKNWNEEAARLLRKRCKIVLNSPKRFIAFNLEMWSCLDSSVSPSSAPCCNHFSLINVHLGTPAVTMFLNKFGTTIKSFELKDSKWSGWQLAIILGNTIPNLEEATVHGAIPKDTPRLFLEGERPFKLPKIRKLDLLLHDKPAAEEDALLAFGRDFLSSVPNLEELRSQDSGKWRSRRERFQRILFELLISPNEGFTLRKLRKVGFSLSPWNDEQLRLLQAKRFPLSYLNLTILPNISSSSLVSLLISLRNSLTKLKLSYTSWRQSEFPAELKLPSLQHLSLDWFNGSVSFIRQFPSLRSFILAQVNLNEIFSEVELKRFGGYVCKTLIKLEVYQQSGPAVKSETVAVISKLFPNIRSLVLGKLNDQSLRAVFAHFPRLEELGAMEGSFSDAGVIGVDAQICGVCRKEHLAELCKGMYHEDIVNERKFHDSVECLLNLRKLVLKSPNLTNLSVIHGIVFCRRLKYLSLWSYNMNFLSLKRIIDTLLELDYLETTHSFGHIAEIRYALAKMMGRKFVLNGLVAPTFCSLISPEASNFVSQFHDNVCRSILRVMKTREPSPPFDISFDISMYQSRRHVHQQNLLLIYEACMAEQYALQGLIDMSTAVINATEF